MCQTAHPILLYPLPSGSLKYITLGNRNQTTRHGHVVSIEIRADLCTRIIRTRRQ